MNLQRARIVLRPRSSAETLDLGVLWCTRVGGRVYLSLVAAILVPCIVLCQGLHALVDMSWPMTWAVAYCLACAAQGVFTVAASRLMFESNVTVRAVLSQFGRRFHVYLGALIVTRVIQLVGLSIVVAFPWAWGYGAFAHEAVLLEGHGVVAGVGRAGRFASGQYGAVLKMGASLAIVAAALAVGVDLLGGAFFDFVLQLGRPFGTLWDDGGSLSALVGFFAAVPLIASVRFLQYIDARTRRDGWDLQFSFLALTVANRADPRTGGEG